MQTSQFSIRSYSLSLRETDNGGEKKRGRGQGGRERKDGKWLNNSIIFLCAELTFSSHLRQLIKRTLTHTKIEFMFPASRGVHSAVM